MKKTNIKENMLHNYNTDLTQLNMTIRNWNIQSINKILQSTWNTTTIIQGKSVK